MNKQVEKSEYEIQADQFLARGDIKFTAKFLFHGPHWEGDKDNRNVWELTLTRQGKQSLSVKFGQSIADSFLWPQHSGMYPLVRYNNPKKSRNEIYCNNNKQPSQHIKPTAYDMLTCLTKYDPGSFENFCGEFGYDTDSRKAERTYNAVREEWYKVKAFFTTEEIAQLSEIQ